MTTFRHNGGGLADPKAVAAQGWARKGWPVFPLDGKHPLVKWQDAATTDPARVRALWRKHPGANVGVVTGVRSGVFVLDVDGDEGRASLASLERQHGRIPKTYRVRSGRGEHIYFRAVEGLRNRAAVRTGLDVRGEGGLVVAAGSVHASGSTYDAVDECASVTTAPEWLLAALASPNGGATATTRSVGVPVADYVAGAVAAEVETLATTRAGGRNDQLNRSACALGHYVGSGQADEAEVFDALLGAALDIDLPEAEARATIRSGLNAGKAEPVRLVSAAKRKPGDDEDVDDVLALVRATFLSNQADESDHLDGLMDDDQLASLPPVEWVIDGWVPRGAYSVLYGPPGAGKTIALTGMGLAVRRGTRWQNGARNTTQTGVLFYQGEGLRKVKDHVDAWKLRYPSDRHMAPVRYRDKTFDVTTESGVAAVIRTVQKLEADTGEPVGMVIIDPLVEFMTGEENGEGMLLAARGLRALAQILDCAVVVGHHTNANESRERGAAFLRMGAGLFMRLSETDEGGTGRGLVQDKNRFEERQAIELDMVRTGPSVVLEWQGVVSAREFAAEQKSKAVEKAAEKKVEQKRAGNDQLRRRVLSYLREHPRASKNTVAAGIGGNRSEVLFMLDLLTEEGVVIREQGAGKAQFHSLA
ncbi:bifunctional DNA primase/polymerase [Blastococcus sp. CT_GayMR16]|uniref:bifunctional DNA primase/polymerase n=1 Tax=Blastococcus sp. CT_GayMR16 TaxID=2559607 RepID=UPI00142F6E01|nr:bifunctional DNA primase/polymerase [Blastococcus sp. CT_GayMR16]